MGNAHDAAAVLPPDPGKVLDKADPGDDVQFRFRYQHSLAAIHCIRLLEASCQYEAVICENFEDVILRRRNSEKYVAVQIKTRKMGLPAYRSSDADWRKSLYRFARLDEAFPDKFDQFVFWTNHVFWRGAKDKDIGHIPYLLAALSERNGIKGLRAENPLRKYIEEICADYGCSADFVVAALLRTVASAAESDLDSPYWHLFQAIVQACGNHMPWQTITKIADNLIYLVYNSSSKIITGDTSDLYSFVSDYSTKKDQLLLDGKTISAETVQKVIEDSRMNSSENLLVTSGCVPGDLLPPGFDVMIEKLNKGELEYERVNVMKATKASLERLYLEWTYKTDVPSANAQLDHLQALVLDDCAEAKAKAKAAAGGQPFGNAMYEDLRGRLRSRMLTETSLPKGCGEAHLLGAAGVLTERCAVWWSDPFDLISKVK